MHSISGVTRDNRMDLRKSEYCEEIIHKVYRRSRRSDDEKDSDYLKSQTSSRRTFVWLMFSF